MQFILVAGMNIFIRLFIICRKNPTDPDFVPLKNPDKSWGKPATKIFAQKTVDVIFSSYLGWNHKVRSLPPAHSLATFAYLNQGRHSSPSTSYSTPCIRLTMTVMEGPSLPFLSTFAYLNQCRLLAPYLAP